MMRLACVALVLATPALADVETREDAIARWGEIAPIENDQIGWRYHLEAQAAGVMTSEDDQQHGGVIGTASADVAVRTDQDCDDLVLGGMVTGRSDEGLFSAAIYGKACARGADDLQMDFRLDWNVTPRLSAPPVMRPGPSRRSTTGFFYEGKWRPANGVIDDPTAVDWTRTLWGRLELAFGGTREDNVVEDFEANLDVTGHAVRHDHGDDKPFTIEYVSLRIGGVMNIAPEEPRTIYGGVRGDAIRIEGYRAGALRLGGRVGGRIGRIWDDVMKSNVIALGEGALSAELGLMRLAVERASYPVWDGRILVDNRGKYTFTGEFGRYRGNVEISAAYTQLFSADVYRTGITGGAAVEAEFDLTDFLSLRARSEVGRTFHTQRMVTDQPVWASETLLLLSAHASRGIKR